MELWRLYATVSIAIGVVVVWTVAATCPRHRAIRDARALERSALWRLVLPLVAGANVIAFFTGWALREPDPADERVDVGLCLLALVAGWVAVRALVRAMLALAPARAPCGPVVTLGLLRCRVKIAEEYRRAASQQVLRAAIAHEAAHARGHDPLRILLAQLAADLQWPLPGALIRFQDWLLALEMRRDDDALATGTCPAALAESILLAARFQKARSSAPIGAGIAGDGNGLALRVRRLIESDSLPPSTSARRFRFAPALFCVVLGTALLLGTRYGELVMATIPGVR